MSKVTELASGQITETETITIELIEADDTAAVVVKWPARPTVCTPSGYEQLLATRHGFAMRRSHWPSSDMTEGCSGAQLPTWSNRSIGCKSDNISAPGERGNAGRANEPPAVTGGPLNEQGSAVRTTRHSDSPISVQLIESSRRSPSRCRDHLAKPCHRMQPGKARRRDQQRNPPSQQRKH